MKPGFYTIIAAQFFSSLADNALLIAAIALLRELRDPAWMTPALKQSFVVSYVVLAPLVGAFADSMPKGRVMLITNAVKIVGCAMMLADVHPLLAYAMVGFGAAAYSPAKYGILTELLPPTQLVIANGWMEGATVLSIILGFLLGGALMIAGGIVQAVIGVEAAGRQLEDIAKPLTAQDAERDGAGDELDVDQLEGEKAGGEDAERFERTQEREKTGGEA